MAALLPQPRTRLHRAAVVALLVVLVLAQTLGWIHRGLHGASGAVRHAQAAAHAHAGEAAPQSGSGWMDDLFGSHADGADCRLFDVLGQPGCVPAALALPPALPPAFFLASTHADFVARWAALFDARGPPASR